MENNTIKEYTFTKTGIKMVNGQAELEEQKYTLNEFQLDTQHKDLLFAQLTKHWNDSPEEVKTRFLHELSFEIQQKQDTKFNKEHYEELCKKLLEDGE